MEENAYITSIIAGACYSTVGLRLLRLSRRTGERPELQLGIYFVLSGVYYLVFSLPALLRFDDWPPIVNVLIEWGYILGVIPYLLFIRTAFRPDQRWAKWLVGVDAVVLLIAGAMVTRSGSVDYSLDSPWYRLEWLAYTTPCVWIGWEALLCWLSSRRRVRIGLCKPVVANRYLLLAIFGAFQVLASVADLWVASEIGDASSISSLTDALLGGAEIASVAVLWLAFVPPRFYADWIKGRAVVLPARMDGQ